MKSIDAWTAASKNVVQISACFETVAPVRLGGPRPILHCYYVKTRFFEKREPLLSAKKTYTCIRCLYSDTLQCCFSKFWQVKRTSPKDKTCPQRLYTQIFVVYLTDHYRSTRHEHFVQRFEKALNLLDGFFVARTVDQVVHHGVDVNYIELANIFWEIQCIRL